jgi:hypothetical protein
MRQSMAILALRSLHVSNLSLRAAADSHEPGTGLLPGDGDVDMAEVPISASNRSSIGSRSAIRIDHCMLRNSSV